MGEKRMGMIGTGRRLFGGIMATIAAAFHQDVNTHNNVALDAPASDRIVPRPRYKLQAVSPAAYFASGGRGKKRHTNRLHLAKKAKLRRRKAAR